MTLRRKTLLIIAGTFYGVIILLFFISSNILLESYTDLEKQSARRDVERVMTAYSQELSNLETTAAEWATWDDTYHFIADHNEAYIRSHLTDGTFTALSLNLMLYMDISRQIVFSKAFDLEEEEEIPLPQSIPKYLAGHDFLVTHRDAETSYAGIIALPDEWCTIQYRTPFGVQRQPALDAIEADRELLANKTALPDWGSRLPFKFLELNGLRTTDRSVARSARCFTRSCPLRARRGPG